jgi:hypothetical protein
LLQQAVRAETFNFGYQLTRCVNHFATGLAPAFLKPYIAGGVSIALVKSETAVRPLACGDPLRRLVAKCFCLAGKEQISKTFSSRNYGVGCKGGVEVVAHSLRDSLNAHRGSKLALLKIDFKNAFNMVSRDHFMKKACEMFPAMSAWTQWCYGEPTMLLYAHEHVIWSESGVQQGDPLGPLYFCCGLNPLVNEIQALDPTYNKWYMDDGGIIGEVEFLKKVWDILLKRGPELGLHLNPSKCEWSWLDPDRSDPVPVSGVAFVPHTEIQMLGVPLGCDEFVSKFVDKKLLGRLQATVDKLVDFEDSQASSYLLRVSYSIVRAVHFMRTTPLHLWQEQAVQFDKMIRKAIESILGFPMNDFTFAQACLTPKLGGLGLRRVVEHADLAYHASWHESLKTAQEVWAAPPGMPAEAKTQSEASYEFDEQMHAYLVSVAPDDREAQRLRRCAQPHASGFITAVPSEEDGRDTILKPRNFRIAVAYRLGVPVLDVPIPCPVCKQTINIFGDHATCCTTNGDVVIRHNTMRNLVDSLASDGLLAPQLEKQGILGPTTGRRPGDVTLNRWSGGPLAIDVAISSPLTKSYNRFPQPCEEYAATQKHGKYDKDFVGTNYSFCAMVWETLGALNDEGEGVLRQIFAFAAKQLGREFSSYCGRAWARVSCCLQRAVSQEILSRIDGREFRERVELEDTPAPKPAPKPAHMPAVVLVSPPTSSSPAQALRVSPPPPPPPSASDLPVSAVVVPEAGVLPIKADGDCCFHVAGVIDALCKDENAVAQDYAPCSIAAITQARSLILKNFEDVVSSKREFFPTPDELEAHVLTFVEEGSDKLLTRVSGKASGEDRHGHVGDLALSVMREDVRVMVIKAHEVWRDSTDEHLRGHAVLGAAVVPGERDKTRAACVVMHDKHYDLCVLRTPQSVCAVFQIGPEWERALQLFLEFVRTRSPLPGQKREWLGARWTAREIEKKDDVSVKSKRAPTRRAPKGRRARARKRKSDTTSESEYVSESESEISASESVNAPTHSPLLSVSVGGGCGDGGISTTQTRTRRQTRSQINMRSECGGEGRVPLLVPAAAR